MQVVAEARPRARTSLFSLVSSWVLWLPCGHMLPAGFHVPAHCPVAVPQAPLSAQDMT